MKPHRLLLSVVSVVAVLAAWTQRAEAATTMASTSTCWSTTQPFTLVSNDQARLTWDVYGNLTLENHMGGGTKVTWGIGSTTPLWGTSAGKLCFGTTWGRLRILDSTGAEVWKSGAFYAANASLSIDQCTVQEKDANGAVLWEIETAQCDKRKIAKPTTASVCWAASAANQRILWDEDNHRELDWYSNGQLAMKKDGVVNWTPPVQGGTMLCYQPDGNFVTYDAWGNPVWAASSNSTQANVTLSMDDCGLVFSAGIDQYKRWNTSVCDRSSIDNNGGAGWCRMKSGANGKILANATSALKWTSNGELVLFNNGTAVWSAPAPAGDKVCFQDDHNLVIYAANGAPLWASNTSTSYGEHLELNLNGCTFSIIDGPDKTLCDKFSRGELCKLGIGQNGCGGPDNGLWCPLQMGAPETFSAKRASCGCGSSSFYTWWSANPSSCSTTLQGGGFSYLKDLRAGNSDFGAELWVLAASTSASGVMGLKSSVAGTGAAAAVNADVPAQPASSWMEVLGDTGVSVTLFGQNQTIMEANAYIGSSTSGLTAGLDFKAMGITLYNATSGSYTKEMSQELWSVDRFYLVEFVPVTVHAGVTGTIGIHLNYNLSDLNHPQASETPYTGLTLDASAGIGTEQDYSAGLEGSLDLVTVSLPFTQKLTVDTRAFEAKTDFSVIMLDGQLDLYAALFPFKATLNLVSWDGYSTSTNLVDRKGTLGF
jgi:hypothetical protein